MVLVFCPSSHHFIYVCKTFNSNPFVRSKIWPGQVSIMKNGYGEITLVNIQDRIIVLVHCPFPYCYLSINQVSFRSLVLSKIWPGQASIVKNGYREITQ